MQSHFGLPSEFQHSPADSRRNCMSFVAAALRLSLLLLAIQAAPASDRAHRAHHNDYPGQHWTQVSRPEDRGWSSEKLAVAKSYAESIDTAGVMIIDDGVVVSQWGETSKAFNVHSIPKSFLSALYGTAVGASGDRFQYNARAAGRR